MHRPSELTVAEVPILHIDLDAFFASVEIIDEPALRGRPVAVGGAGDRGVVASASYEARRFGIHSAMPSVQAKRLCPSLIILPGRFDRYETFSQAFRAIVEDLTPVVEPIGLDELFADLSSLRRLGTQPVAAGHELRRRIHDELGLESGVGLGPNKLFAKLASKRAKPHIRDGEVHPGAGVVAVDAATRTAWLEELPIRALWGVGPATAARLERLGLTMVRELRTLDESVLRRHVGPAMARTLALYAVGDDPRPVEHDRVQKSIGSEETMARSLTSDDELVVAVRRHAGVVARALRKQGLMARTVSVHLRFDSLEDVGRRQSVDFGLDDDDAIGALAQALALSVPRPGPVRLVGVSVASLAAKDQTVAQMAFAFDDAPTVEQSRARQLDRAALTDVVDEVRRRFGDGSVGTGRDFGQQGVDVRRQRDRSAFGPDQSSDTQ